MQTVTHAASTAAHVAPPGLDEAALPRVFRRPSEHLHPAQIDYAQFDDNTILKEASHSLAWAQAGLNGIDELRASPNPEDKPATHARKVREALANFNDVWNSRWDGGKTALKKELQRVETSLNDKANLKPVERHFDAITATFYNMSPGERAEAVAGLISQRDFPTLATLIEAPLLITKLTGEQRDGIRERVLHEVDPKGVALRDQLQTALSKWENAGHATIRIGLRLADGTNRFASRTMEADKVARKVSAGF